MFYKMKSLQNSIEHDNFLMEYVFWIIHFLYPIIMNIFTFLISQLVQLMGKQVSKLRFLYKFDLIQNCLHHLINKYNKIILMSHLRDLQKLRNTRHEFQIKKNSQPLHQPKNINNHKYPNPQQDRLLIPQLYKRDIEETTKFEDFGADPYKKYLQSKEIMTNRDSRDSVPKTCQKIKHKRGASFGIGSTYYNARTKDIPQSGLSIYNFTSKMSSVHGESVQINSQNSRRTNPLTSRRQKVPQLFVINDPEFEKRHSKELKIRKQSKLPKQLKEDGPISKQSFEIFYPVGKGGFGKVWKVKLKKSQQIFAMKEMQKSKIINKKSVNSVMNERTLLSQINHPFLVNMLYAFQDRENLYLVIDYLNGGDLRYHIGCKGKFTQAESKFFIANILISLEYLHKKKIIHRDLKPENFVFDSDGYLRITDFGVSRIVREDNHQDTSGTPGYMSPEVICHKNHTYTTDFFALGVMAYEFMLGRRPYNGRNRKQIRQSILTKQAQVKLDQLPYRWSPKAADFINMLLMRNPEKRLGTNGIDEVKNHPWLADLDWKGIHNKAIKSPYIPLSIQQNYDDYKDQISEDTVDENVSETKMMLREKSVQQLFEGYQYSHLKLGASKKRTTNYSTNYTESEKASLRGSGK